MALNRWFLFFLARAISQRKGRFIISSSAVVLVVSVVTALATLSSGVGEKIGNELKQYGANMMVSGRSGSAIEREVADDLRHCSQHIRDSALQVYGLGTLHGKSVEIIAMEPGKITGFRIQGAFPKKDDEIMIGVDLKEGGVAKEGDRIRFENGMKFAVSGVFEKGSKEDSAAVVTLGASRDLLGIHGISAVLLNVDTRYLETVKHEITGRYPDVEVKTIRQVAVAEEGILRKMQLLMFIVTITVVFASVIALGSTMGANVIERTEEIGLMKAIGATGVDIRNFFIAESTLAGFLGAIAGYVLGVASAEAVSRTAFGSYVSISPFFILLAIPLGVCISIFSTFLPVIGAMKLVPARTLKGE